LAPCTFFDPDEGGDIAGQSPELAEQEDEGAEESEEETEDEDLEPDDYINIYINNRNHIRDLSKILAPVCGLVLTGALGLLYFILNSNDSGVPTDPKVIYLLVAASVFLTFSIIFSIQSVTVKAQDPLSTKFEYISDLDYIYAREFGWARLSAILLLLGISLFILSMCLFYVEYMTTTTLTNHLINNSFYNVSQTFAHVKFGKLK